MDKLGNLLDILVSSFVVLVSVNDVQSIISIVMLVIQSLYIIVRLTLNCYKLYKEGKVDKIQEEVNKFTDSLEDLTDNGKLDNSNKEHK